MILRLDIKENNGCESLTDKDKNNDTKTNTDCNHDFIKWILIYFIKIQMNVRLFTKTIFWITDADFLTVHKKHFLFKIT